jgi:hypothetical protein
MSELQPQPQAPEPVDAELQQDLNTLQAAAQAIEAALQGDPTYDPRNNNGVNDIETLQELIQDTTELLDAMKGSSVAATRQAQNLRRQYIAPAQRALEAARQRVTQLDQANRPEPERQKAVPPNLEKFNRMMAANYIEPFDMNVSTEEEFIAERERLSEAVCAFVIGLLNSRLGDKSSEFVPSMDAGLWAGVTMETGIPNSDQTGNLDFLITTLPSKVVLEINNVSETRDFLGETKSYLASLIKLLEAEHDRAVALQTYASPQEYITTINSASFKKIGFGKEQLNDIMVKDNAREREQKATSERNVGNSVYEAFRLIKHHFVSMADFLEPGQTVDRVDRYMRQLKKNNMYPLGLKQSLGEKKGDVATQTGSLEWMAQQLVSQGFSEEVITLAFRWAVASNRSTGLEEFLDVRPNLKEDNNENPIIPVDNAGNPQFVSKVQAVRSMTRIFHSEAWAKYSVAAKGTGRQPVALDLASKRPSMGLPAEMNWLVMVDLGGGKMEERSIFEVYRDQLWDQVLPASDRRAKFPDDPNSVYGQHLNNMAKPYYEALFMDEKAPHILPNREKMAKYFPLPLARRDRRIARIFQMEGRRRTVNNEDAQYLLDRLYSNDAEKMLIMTSEDDLPDYTSANALKDGADYAWDNTLIYRPNFERMFKSPNGGPHRAIMEAVDNNNKPQFVMWTFITMLIMAEIERYRIPEEELERATEQWHSGNIDLAKPVETASKQNALHRGEVIALKRFILRLQAGLPEEYRRYHFTPDQIDIMFRKFGIIDTDAAKNADLHWLFGTPVLRSTMEVKPTILKGLDELLDFVGYDEGIT